MRFKGTKDYCRHRRPRRSRSMPPSRCSGRCWSRASPAPARRCWPIEVAKALRRAADRVAHQVDHQGAAGPLRIRRGEPPARQPARRRARAATSATTSARASCGRRSRSDERPVLLIDEIDKADIEFPNDLLQELDRMEFYVYETRETDQGHAPADRDHHLQQREGAARRLPAPLLLPLHHASPTPTPCARSSRCTSPT